MIGRVSYMRSSKNRLVTMPQMHRQMALLRRNLADRKKSLRKITQSVSNAARKQLRKNLLRKRKTQSQKPYSLLPPLMTQQRWLQKAHPNAEAVSLKMLLSLPSLIPVPRSLNQSRWSLFRLRQHNRKRPHPTALKHREPKRNAAVRHGRSEKTPRMSTMKQTIWPVQSSRHQWRFPKNSSLHRNKTNRHNSLTCRILNRKMPKHRNARIEECLYVLEPILTIMSK